MGLFDGILGRKGSDSTKSGAGISADRVQEEYQRTIQAGVTPSGNLLLRMGDIFRDLRDRDRAVEFYLQAAEQFVREENWSLAEATTRRVEPASGGAANRVLLCQLEVALGRRLPAAARAVISRLEQQVRPSDGDIISKMVEVVDFYALRDTSIEVSLAEFLCSVGRPERAVERLQVALRTAKQGADEATVRDIEERLGDLDPVGGSIPMSSGPVSGNSSVARPKVVPPEAVPPRRATSPSEEVRVAPVPTKVPFIHSGAEVRVIGTDGRSEGRDDDQAVRELVRQLRAGLDENIPVEDAETHFDLGFAFLEMRLYEEAVREFSMAFRSQAFRVRAAQGLAQALIEGGDASRADEVLASVRPEIGPGEVSHGLAYWHARAYEAMGRFDAASALLGKIHQEDPGFQDVGDRLARLGARL